MPALLDDEASYGRIGDAAKTSTTAEELPCLVNRQVFGEEKFVNRGAVGSENGGALLVGARLLADACHLLELLDFVMQGHDGSPEPCKKSGL